MFDSKYKEALEDMKLTDSFKAGLVNMMKKEQKRAIPRSRLVLATVVGVILVTTSVTLAANYASDGQLFKNVFSSLGFDPQQTKDTLPVETEATEATEATQATEATEASQPSDMTEAPTAAPTLEPTAAPVETTAAPTPKETVKETVKETAPPAGRVAPVVSVGVGTNSITVYWNKIDSPDLIGYKVVASISDSTPSYSENGYYAWTTDANTTSSTITNGDGYNGGDIGRFTGGQSYYFSVTAIYGEEWQKIPGNAVAATMPGSSAAPTYEAPSVNASAGSNSVTVTWNKISSPGIVGYKVVASISDSTPMYSENGYYEWITDLNRTSCTISSGVGYNGGDVGTFTAGQAYYFSVTAVYGDQKIAGNAVQVTMPGTPPPAATCPAVSVSASAGAGGVNVSWSKTTDATGFHYYKVVASVGNSAPAYPGDGYVTYITDPNITSYFIGNTAGYNSGDFGAAFTPGTTYWFSVTACYDGGNTPGNAVQVTMPS